VGHPEIVSMHDQEFRVTRVAKSLGDRFLSTSFGKWKQR
jgi:hypothetical protein